MDVAVPPSPALLAANRRLYELRARVRAEGLAAGGCRQRGQQPVPGLAEPPLRNAGSAALASLPDHLGWESQTFTAVMRLRQQETGHAGNNEGWIAQPSDSFPRGLDEGEVTGLGDTAVAGLAAVNHSHDPGAGGWQSSVGHSPRSATSNSTSNSWVKLYPDIGLGMLRQELAAPGRLWFILRYLDKEGSGTLCIDITEQQLTRKDSPLRLCGRRQLRNLLRAGNGVYWTRDKQHIWLRSAARVAYILGVARLTGRPVALPLAALLDGIGPFRAHLYTAFHSGRTKETPYGEQAAPIARETLAGLSGVGRSSQRAYEQQTGVEVQANFAVGEAATEENQENRAWTRGQALFRLQDCYGRQGRKGKSYLAWQLPNSYVGQHQKRPKGRQKRINRELKDLVTRGTPGNVEETSGTCRPALRAGAFRAVAGKVERPAKVYYPDGKLAAKACGRDPKRELYWKRHRTGNSRFVVWQQMGGQ
jgi:hypothetical protein